MPPDFSMYVHSPLLIFQIAVPDSPDACLNHERRVFLMDSNAEGAYFFLHSMTQRRRRIGQILFPSSTALLNYIWNRRQICQFNSPSHLNINLLYGQVFR